MRHTFAASLAKPDQGGGSRAPARPELGRRSEQKNLRKAATRFATRSLVSILVLSTLAGSVSCGGGSSPTAPSGGSGGAAAVTGILLGVPPLAQANSFFQVAAFAQYSNFTMADVTSSATWTSSNSQIAVLSNVAGLPVFQTLRTGSVTITASFSGRSASQVVVIQ